ncbi:hypothetical protein H4R21_005311 [Coemansia helicoidea]|uniref:Uncharacterized protein n=1 Tax=Coemansia helicoidea TaxID=1286919 RepID=A0ACC1KUH7_9FUNG|nr:hypothetical protein H4R21_005311 [Coemansia helicoidea]
MSTITKLGAGKGAVIESVEDYRHQLKRSILMPLHDLRPNEMRSVLVVVTRVSAVKKSQGTDYVLSLQVADPTVGYDSSVLVSIFRRSAETMPDVRGPGDILYLESAKTELFGGQCHLCSNFSTCWQVHHHDTPTDGLHPLLAYLRGWWLARGACDPAALASLPCAASAAALDDSTTTAAANPVAPPAHPPPAGNPKVSNNPPNTCFQTQYFKLIRDFEAGRFGDIIVELVHVEPPVADPFFVGHQMQRCLVTDYTANPLLSLAGDIPAAKRVGGRRLAWCEVHEVDKINKMPALLPSRAYWMRGVRGVQSPAHGLALDVRLHATYQRTILVMEIDDDHPDLEPLKERRRTVLAANDLPPQMPPSLPPLTMHKLSLAERSSAAPAPPSWVAGTAVTPIASIYADQQVSRHRDGPLGPGDGTCAPPAGAGR